MTIDVQPMQADGTRVPPAMLDKPVALTAARKRLVLAATIVGSSMAFIDGSVVNVAMPSIQHSLAFDAQGTQWVINSYLLLLGALVLVGGAAADRFGRRLVFLIGVIAFTLASIGCGLAPDGAVLIFARGMQGAGAALLTPASLAILGSSFTDAERGRAVGAWAGFGALTAAGGPVLGGWLVDVASWRAIFFLNVPLAALTILMTVAAVPESRVPGAKRLDYLGAILVASGLGAITWGLTRSSTASLFDPLVLALVFAGLSALAAFLLVEARSVNPMMPLMLFRSRNFIAVNLLTLCLYFAMGGAQFFVPFELIRAHGYSAAYAGAALLPFSLVMGGLSGTAGRFSDRVGARIPLIAGPLVSAGGFLFLAAVASSDDYWTSFFPATLVLALGMTISVAPLTATVINSVKVEHAGTASGINVAIARIAALLAIAVLSLVFLGRFDDTLAVTADRMGLAGDLPPPGSGLTVRPLDGGGLRQAEQAALNAAYIGVMLISAVAAIGGALAAGMMKSNKQMSARPDR